jgi:hypothetical protein
MRITFMPINFAMNFAESFEPRGRNVYCFAVLDNNYNRTFKTTKTARKYLEEKFPSMVFESNKYTKNSGRYNTFYFENPADDAFFLLWTGGQAEIEI